MSAYAALKGYYHLRETIGSGGFGKVKLAYHAITGEKVAIKIMDKKALGDDLPRVIREIAALKALTHQYICKLYQVIETEGTYYLILEYCSGGELFDYIVSKDRLEEDEARNIFRQLVSAVAYIHHSGYAHRDLKPENILLDSEQNIKLIDFGLCAKPDGGMTTHLKTCCGSPAYAAPELISGKPYLGNEVDLWSMGILLYALMCGYLPFDDDNLSTLYRKIKTGKYDTPNWLSQDSLQVIGQLLQIDPQRRITVRSLLTHPWVLKGSNVAVCWKSRYLTSDYDIDCVDRMAGHYNLDQNDVLNLVSKWSYNYLTATYLLLLQRKNRGKAVVLFKNTRALAEKSIHLQQRLQALDVDSVFDSPVHTPTRPAAVPASPRTPIHLQSPLPMASFDSDLTPQNAGSTDDAKPTRGEATPAQKARVQENMTPHKENIAPSPQKLQSIPPYSPSVGGPSAVAASPQAHHTTAMGGQAGSTQQPHDASAATAGTIFFKTPQPVGKARRHATAAAAGVASLAAASSACGADSRKTPPATGTPRFVRDPNEGKSPSGLEEIRTPYRRVVQKYKHSPLSPSRSMDSQMNKAGESPSARGRGGAEQVSIAQKTRAGSVDTQLDAVGVEGPSTPLMSAHTPSGHHGSRKSVFGSIERGLNKMFNSLTPRKKSVSKDGLKKVKALHNVSNMSTETPESLLKALTGVLKEKGIKFIHHGDNGVRCSIADDWGKVHLAFDFEICALASYDMVGIRRKRVKGESMHYKRLCHDILAAVES